MNEQRTIFILYSYSYYLSKLKTSIALKFWLASLTHLLKYRNLPQRSSIYAVPSVCIFVLLPWNSSNCIWAVSKNWAKIVKPLHHFEMETSSMPLSVCLCDIIGFLAFSNSYKINLYLSTIILASKQGEPTFCSFLCTSTAQVEEMLSHP